MFHVADTANFLWLSVHQWQMPEAANSWDLTVKVPLCSRHSPSRFNRKASKVADLQLCPFVFLQDIIQLNTFAYKIQKGATEGPYILLYGYQCASWIESWKQILNHSSNVKTLSHMFLVKSWSYRIFSCTNEKGSEHTRLSFSLVMVRCSLTTSTCSTSARSSSTKEQKPKWKGADSAKTWWSLCVPLLSHPISVHQCSKLFWLLKYVSKAIRIARSITDGPPPSKPQFWEPWGQ